MIQRVAIIINVGLLRDVVDPAPSDDEVREAVLEAVNRALKGYTHDSLDGEIAKSLPNGVSIDCRTSGAILGPDPHVPDDVERLKADRKEAADAYFDQFDFGDLVVKDSNGWQKVLGQPTWKKVVFFENRSGGDSLRGEFYVVFKDGTAEIEDGDYSL